MAFILEKISEEDMKKYGLESKLLEKISEEGMKLGLNLTRGCGPNREYMIRSGASGSWAIDRDRDVFLIKVRANGYAGVGMYELHYPNEAVVNFDAEERAIGNNGDAFFKLSFLRMPFSLKENAVSVQNDIVMSLKKFGYFADPKDVNINVEVNLPLD